MKYVGLAVVGIGLFLALMAGMMYFSVSNQEITLRNQVKAQQENLKVVFDTTWKIIQQQAEVADQYKDAFAKIYPALMSGRYGNQRGGALLSFIKESNPEFNINLYEKLANSIEAQRITFAGEQKKLIDLKREHDNLRQTFPNNLIVGSRPEIVLEIVTSDKTNEAFKTGKENDVKLFGSKK
ncbi:Uncharacterised protein [uncultured archaeon]|nr:Uncharacterised protein [uncultured archaeon]